jgi:hypothetical protein
MIVLKLGEHVLLYGVDPTLVDHVSLSVQRDLHIRIGDCIKVFFDVAKAGYLFYTISMLLSLPVSKLMLVTPTMPELSFAFLRKL